MSPQATRPTVVAGAALVLAVLLLLEPGIVRHVHPALWEYVVFPLLQVPAALIFAVIGLALALAARSPTPRRRRRPGWR